MKAKADRVTKDIAKENKKAEQADKKATKAAKKATKEAKKAADEAEEAITGKSRRGRKRKRPAVAEDTLEPNAKVRQINKVSEPAGLQKGWQSEEQEQEQVAPVARMIQDAAYW